MNERAAQAQAFLFAEGGALSRRKLAAFLDIAESDLTPIVRELSVALEGTGLSVVATESDVTLAAAPGASAALAAAYERELGREIGDAGLEVLAIVLYRGPSTRAQIDYIRGVNTSSTIRTLLARGLIERTGNPDDAREYVYRPTTELLAHLGVRLASELPERDTIGKELAEFESTRPEPTLANDHD